MAPCPSVNRSGKSAITRSRSRRLVDVSKRADYSRGEIDDPDRCEYFVPVQWLETRPVEAAVQEIGFFGNQNTVCKPRSTKWRTTVERLERIFTKSSGPKAREGDGS